MDKVTAAPQPGAGDGATSNCKADKANEGAKEKMEKRRSDLVWEDEEQKA